MEWIYSDYLVHLAIGSISNNLDELKNASRILKVGGEKRRIAKIRTIMTTNGLRYVFKRDGNCISLTLRALRSISSSEQLTLGEP